MSKEQNEDNKIPSLFEILTSPRGITGMGLLLSGVVVCIIASKLNLSFFITIIGVLIAVSGTNLVLNLIKEIG